MNILIIHFRSLLFAFFALAFLLLFANDVLFFSDKLSLSVIGFFLLITFYATYKIEKKIIFAIIPISIIISALALLFFIDSVIKRDIFAIGVSIVYYSAFLAIVRLRNNSKDMTARTFFSISIISTIFFFFAASYGIYINFEIPLWIFITIGILFLVFMTFASLYTYSKNIYRTLLASTILSFLIAQIMWMMNFWPFGYLTDSCILVVFYYVLWDMHIMIFTNTLSKKRVVNNIIIGMLLLFMLLFTSRWVLMK